MGNGWEGVMRPRRRQAPVETPVRREPQLRGTILCDADNVAAAAKWVRTETGILYFCKHHFRRHLVEITIRRYEHDDV